MPSRQTKSAIDSLRRHAPDIVVLDASDPQVETVIAAHIFKGQAFALNYDGVPAEQRDGLQSVHVAHMKRMQDLAKERFATTLN
jgi:hypothetical protein